MRRRITFIATDQTVETTMSDERLIQAYNNNANIENKHAFINNTIASLKAELVKRNIISDDHEGPIETI